MREIEWKPSNFLAKKKVYELISPSHFLAFPGFLYKLFDFADHAIVTEHDHNHKYLYQLSSTCEQTRGP